jgi:hypothetical protein
MLESGDGDFRANASGLAHGDEDWRRAIHLLAALSGRPARTLTG